MLKSQELASSFIPSKEVVVFPEAQVDLTPGGQTILKVFLDPSMGFCDPKNTRLMFDLEMTGRGRPVPNGKAGVHSLWRDVRIQDGMGQATLEEIQDYNVLTAQWWSYTQNDSIRHKREMFEGLQVDPAVGHNLFWSGEAQDWADALVDAPPEGKKLQIQMPVNTGLLSGEKIFPLMATKGLRLQMSLDTVARGCVYSSGLAGVNHINHLKMDAASAKTGGTSDSKTAVDDQFSVIVKAPNSDFGVYANSTPFNINPFEVGDVLYIANALGVEEEVLGVIAGFEANSGDGLLKINYIPARADGVALVHDHAEDAALFVKSLDRVNGVTVSNVPQAYIDYAAVKVGFVMSNIQMLVSVVSPPEGYVKGMLAQLSGKGLAFDYKTWSLQRSNLTSLDGLLTQLIPTREKRCLSVLSVPLAQSYQTDLLEDSLTGVVDGIVDYQYTFGSSLIPDRPVELGRYSHGIPKPEALHLAELEKALTNTGLAVRDIHRVAKRFLIGRAFSRYGQVADLSVADLTLRVQYQLAAQIKLFDHFISHLRRVIISSAGVKIE